ncbi:MAG TPA: FAD-binding oxidoreductase [Kofleriaceae bacterium]|nr:FAD-binding oxidoreductase [Kofleriaceae bacterium]
MSAAAVDVRDDDAILGVRPRVAYAPASVDECAEVMALTARERMKIGFIGGRTEMALGAPPRALDAVVRTERLARILEHVPADMVVVAEAGVTLAALQAALAAHGQQLAIDPPLPERATIGGLVATGGFGPRRARYGTMRDLIIGVTLVRADGTVARGGGKVVKNVAGFDLPKVACGSLGTLGMIATASFRLHPLPEVSTTVLVPAITADAVVATVAAARAAQLEPTSAVALSAPDGRFDLALRFEGFRGGVDQQVSRMVELARAAGAAPNAAASATSTAAPQPLSGDAAAAFWRRHDAVRTAAALRVRFADLPTRFPAIAAGLSKLGDVAWYATLGIGFAGGAVTDPTAATTAISAARTQLVAGGGSLVVETAPAELRAIDPWGPPPGSFAIMKQLKQRFDPDGRLNPGRFVGEL